MPQMTNVLLANVDVTGDKVSRVSASSAAKGTENSEFSIALEQASVNTKQEAASSDHAEPMPATHTSSDTEVEPKEAKNSDEVSHVLAQINLATQLAEEETLAVDGANLPLPMGEMSNIANLEDVDNTAEATSVVEVISDKVNTELNSSLISDSDDNAVLAPAVSDSDDNVALGEQEIELQLNQLTSSQIDSLVTQSGLSEQQLSALPPQALNEILIAIESDDPLKLQQAVTEAKGILGLLATADLNGAETTIANSGKYGAEVAPVTVNPNSKVDVNAMVNSENKPTMTEGKSSVLPSSESLSERGSILGEAKQKDTESQYIKVAKTEVNQGNVPTVDLKQAKLEVTMQKILVSQPAGQEFADTSSSESKLASATLSPIPTPTSMARGEALPQYQVSIKPTGEPAQQMQEMIAKFSPVMRQQLVAMVSQGVQHAEIRLDPPELGQMMVRIQVQGDQTQVQFHVMQNQTKDIVEQALPRLREMLAEQGMQLTDSNVSHGGGGQGQGDTDSSDSQGDRLQSEMDELSAEDSLLVSNSSTSYRSGIDYYA
ncbi:flagellar hook-length control protein FliK [Shewanella colwelliana]|uniref:Flagellar hook-length control protein FliK n=1 Tax=Shewanella colwelliana TaxID=23 RepID=A0ABQ4P7L3_SHECO|nr:flagellar hook-length control protein FliK [Shewanella colwelliana]GIU43490.1 flagellar hook-length control protein FliK [Shewanella colwelliana]